MGGVQIAEKTWERIETSVSQSVGEAFTKEKWGSDTHKLGVALSLLAMLETGSLGKKANQTLEQYDSEARDALALRRVHLEKRRDAWAATEEVKRVLSKARASGIAAVLGSNPTPRIQAHAEYLKSDAFLSTTRSLPDATRAERLKAEALRIVSLDADLGQEVARAWMADELKCNPLRAIRGVCDKKATQALEDVLALLAKLSGDDDAMRHAAGPQGPKGAMMIPGTAIHKLIATAAARRTIATGLSQAMRTRSFYSSLAADDPSLIAKLKADGVPGAELLEKIAKAGFVGRGITSFFSLWGLAAVTECFPPVDKDGKVKWGQLAVSTSTGLSIAGNLPDIGKFLSADVGPLLGKFLSTEFKAAKVVQSACTATKVTQAAKFVRVCEFLGPVGDAIALPMAFMAVGNERRNEDAVGVATNVVGCVSSVAGLTGGILVLAGSGVGLPLAVAAAFVGITAALIDAGFGESALTGKIREDLRYLGVSDKEEKTYERLTTEMRTVTRGYGGYGYGGTYTARQRCAVSSSTVRQRAQTANRYEKVQLLTKYLEGWTTSSDEKLVWQVLYDTPYTNNEFLDLMKAVDARRVARELENDDHAAKVMIWTIRAYERANEPIGAAFNDQLLQHCREHHDGAVTNFHSRVVVSNPSGDQISLDTYAKIDPKVIVEATKLLMAGNTDGDEERAVYRLLAKTDHAQFCKAIEYGKTPYLRQLKDELGSILWHDLHDDMTDKRSTPAVRHYARIVRK